MTLAEILRKACAANNLGTTGSSAVLLARLVKSNKKTRAEDHALSRVPRFPRPPHALHALETVCVFVCPLVVALWPRH